LSRADVQGLLAGSGMPFGGMAKAAELNGYPGPRHVLDLHKAGKLALTPEQYRKTRELYEKMRAEAIPLGKQILKVEKEIDRAFARRTITESFLRQKVAESAELYGKLRFVHLKYHLAMTRLLTPQQIQQYNELRGYHHRENGDCAGVSPAYPERRQRDKGRFWVAPQNDLPSFQRPGIDQGKRLDN